MNKIKKLVSYIIKFCLANLNFTLRFYFLRKIDEDNDGR